MLSRRIARAALAAPRSMRAFSSTAAQQKAPTMADIVPNQVEEFNAKQRAFRERLVRAQREREESK
jgi:hypothetical protein